MWVIFDRRQRVQDTDPSLNFAVSKGDKDDYEVALRGRSTPLLEAIGINKEQLIHLRDQIDKVLSE